MSARARREAAPTPALQARFLVFERGAFDHGFSPFSRGGAELAVVVQSDVESADDFTDRVQRRLSSIRGSGRSIEHAVLALSPCADERTIQRRRAIAREILTGDGDTQLTELVLVTSCPERQHQAEMFGLVETLLEELAGTKASVRLCFGPSQETRA